MDCPTGGSTNVSEILGGAPINLDGWQQVAVYWSIFWPAALAGTILGAYAFEIHFPGSNSYFDHTIAYSLYDNLAVFVLQAVVIHRLVRKNFRMFHLEVVRQDGQRSRTFSMREGILVWLRFIWPQVMVGCAIWLVALVTAAMRSRLGIDISLRPPTSITLFLNGGWLWLGAIAVTQAIRAPYPGFRLEAFGSAAVQTPAVATAPR